VAFNTTGGLSCERAKSVVESLLRGDDSDVFSCERTSQRTDFSFDYTCTNTEGQMIYTYDGNASD
jgi:hypothetical protein